MLHHDFWGDLNLCHSEIQKKVGSTAARQKGGILVVRRNLRVAACAFIVGILFALSATVVFAATATSPWGYYGPFLDYYYKNQASVTSDYPPGVYAITKAAQDGTSNVPTGIYGCQG